MALRDISTRSFVKVKNTRTLKGMFVFLQIGTRWILLVVIICATALVALSVWAAQFISAKTSHALGAGSNQNSLAVVSCDLVGESQDGEIYFAGCMGFL